MSGARGYVRWIVPVSVVVLFAGTVALLRPQAVDVRAVAVVVDGETRSARIVVPRDLAGHAALVVAFHGTGDTPESMAAYSGLDGLAARHGFLLAYPRGRNGSWRTANLDPHRLDGLADVRFHDRLLADLSARHSIDRRRVYAVGMSTGASFAQLLAVARPDDLAALVAHSGARPAGLGRPRDTASVPTLLVVGSTDPALGSMRSDADDLRAAGRTVELVVVPDLGHEWSTEDNERMWDFLSAAAAAR